jgi:hypothetical protein
MLVDNGNPTNPIEMVNIGLSTNSQIQKLTNGPWGILFLKLITIISWSPNRVPVRRLLRSVAIGLGVHRDYRCLCRIKKSLLFPQTISKPNKVTCPFTVRIVPSQYTPLLFFAVNVFSNLLWKQLKRLSPNPCICRIFQLVSCCLNSFYLFMCVCVSGRGGGRTELQVTHNYFSAS